MDGTSRRPRWHDIGHATAVGLAFAPFALLSAFWIPSLALILGTIAVAAGGLDVRASGRAARFAALAIGLGILAIVIAAIVVVVTTPDPASATAVSVVGRP